jgi:hypothetical protein
MTTKKQILIAIIAIAIYQSLKALPGFMDRFNNARIAETRTYISGNKCDSKAIKSLIAYYSNEAEFEALSLWHRESTRLEQEKYWREKERQCGTSTTPI